MERVAMTVVVGSHRLQESIEFADRLVGSPAVFRVAPLNFLEQGYTFRG
jgi:hypothetical protein